MVACPVAPVDASVAAKQIEPIVRSIRSPPARCGQPTDGCAKMAKTGFSGNLALSADPQTRKLRRYGRDFRPRACLSPLDWIYPDSERNRSWETKEWLTK